ncbi:MAG: antitoxin [Ignavibacteria bacterium]|nr:antitoxin [Ignavibacteria bacterium]
MKYLKMNEEKELLESYENDEWVPVKDLDKKKIEYQLIARNTALKNRRINVRLSEKDLSNLKAKSLEEGLPYQTLVASIIHKYVAGKFKEL